MDTSDYTINRLFNGDTVFVVPRYQRLYVWNEEDQWEPLWDDVKHIADRLFESAKERGTSDIDQSKAESHFIGTLVLKARQAKLDSAQRWQVIDGQQRLTTLQLMLSAVADEFMVRGHDDEGLRHLTTNRVSTDPLMIEHRVFDSGVNPYIGFVQAMTANSDKDEISGPMGDCYWFFRGAVAEWFDAEQDQSLSTIRANALGTSIRFKFRVVAIELDPHEEEHKIFETLNARGAPLTEWDKIKNAFLAKADSTMDDDVQDDFYAKYLNRFDEDWWRGKTGSGAQSRPRTDFFAGFWVESNTGEPVGVRRVFREFQQYVETSDAKIETIAVELTKDAAYYQRYEQHCDGNDTHERAFHDRRLMLNAGALWHGICLLNRKLEDVDAIQEVRDESFGILDSFLVRRKLLNYSSRAYAQVGFDLIKGIQNISDAAILPTLIRETLSAKYDWPSDAEVSKAVVFNKHSRPLRSLVLKAIESELIPLTAGYQTLAGDLEVEHLMPQRWSDDDWPMPPIDWDEAREKFGLVGDSIAVRDSLVDTFGNLTLITSGLNKRLSNGSWQHKRKLVEQSDNLFINKRLLKDASDVWDERGIFRRGMWIARKVCEIWPRPDDVASN